MREFSQKEIKFIETEYKNNREIAAIANDLKCSQPSIVEVIQNNKIQKERKPHFKLSKETIYTIIEEYNNGQKQWQIADKYGCSQGQISKILRKNGIETRIGKKIKYSDINTSFFDKIDCEENAYFLGLLYADGCVQTDNNAYTTTLKLQKQDQAIIEKLRDIISPSSPIILVDDNKYAKFRTSQKVITDQLIILGCIPRKSLILKFPTIDVVPTKFISHFLRGYSDGDGTIFYSILHNKYSDYKIYHWRIVSTKDFCISASNLLDHEINISGSISLSEPKTNQITSVLAIGGNKQVETVLDWLYKDATIYLQRKYDKYIEFKNYLNDRKLNPPSKRPDVNIEQLIYDYQKNDMTTLEIAAKHNTTTWFLYATLKRNNIPFKSAIK